MGTAFHLTERFEISSASPLVRNCLFLGYWSNGSGLHILSFLGHVISVPTLCGRFISRFQHRIMHLPAIGGKVGGPTTALLKQ